MITILKFPIYVQVESDNIGRDIVSRFSKEILYPELLSFLADAKYKKKILEKLSQNLGGPVSVSLLTEIDLIQKSVSKELPSTHEVK